MKFTESKDGVERVTIQVKLRGPALREYAQHVKNALVGAFLRAMRGR
jgi:hypothetical protein